jgi:hypothetical protein
VDNLDLQWAVALGTNAGQVDLRDIGIFIRGKGLRGFVDLVGNGLGGGGTVGQVVLDTKVGIGT